MALALHPATVSCPGARWRAVVAVLDVGRRALRCSATLLLAHADSAPPGGEVAPVPPPPLPPDRGGRDPLGGAQRRDPRGSLTFPWWLFRPAAAACLLPVAFVTVTVTCFCQGESKTWRRKLYEHSPRGCRAKSGQVGPSHSWG